MRRSVPLVVIALAALAASGANAKNPAPPAGTWDLQTTSASYSGPATKLRSALSSLIRKRVSFSPACTMTVCASYATVQTRAGRRVTFVLRQAARGAFTGRVKLATGLRCGGRALRATLELSATVVRRQQDVPDRLSGATSRRAVDPGGCAVFRNYTRVVQKTQFRGVAVTR